MTFPQEPSGSDVLRAILYMCVVALVMFPLLNGSTKYLSADYAIMQIVWARSIGHFLCTLAVFAPRRGWRLFATRRPGLQLARSSLQLAGTVAFVTALVYIPLATATAIAFTAPLMVTMLSIPFLGERVGPRRWAAVAVGLVGALIIIRPGVGTHWAALLVAGSAAAYALFQVLTRKLAVYDDAPTTATYTVVVALIATSLIAPLDLRLPDDGLDWLVFLGLGVLGGLGHYFVIKAFETGPASVIAPFDYGQLIGVTIIGYVVFGDFPDLWTWIGAAIIVGSGLYILRREAFLRAAKRAPGRG